MTEKDVEKALMMVLAFFQLSPTDMRTYDQFYYISIMMKFAEMVEPLVKEYGGSVEELQKKYDSQKKEQQFKDIASAMVLKAMMDKQSDNKEDDKEDK